eukprot:4647759-Pleurochrysis_carterae.AAC.1
MVRTNSTSATQTSSDSDSSPVGLSVDQVVRCKANGHFVRVLAIFKPLPRFVATESTAAQEVSVDVERDETLEHTVVIARQPRYFGSNPGYFTGDKCAMVLVWDRNAGIAYCCADLNALSNTFAFDEAEADDFAALGPDFVVRLPSN